MAKTEWFRNEDWSPTIEAHFFEKLGRARDKAQYLRIQACYLARKRPEVALTLLERYFALADKFDKAQAFVDQATAYSSLGRTEEAIWSLLKALESERTLPTARTAAWREFALLVVSERRSAYYEKALRVLEEHSSELIFPVEKFIWHATTALIKEAHGDFRGAATHAEQALTAAQLEHSGFRYHPKAGLVGSDYESIRQRLLRLTTTSGK